MLYDVSVHLIGFFGSFYFYISTVILEPNKQTIIPLARVGFETITANSAIHSLSATYHLISNARSWNDSPFHGYFFHLHYNVYQRGCQTVSG